MIQAKHYDPISALIALPKAPPVLLEGCKGWSVRLLHRLIAAQQAVMLPAPSAWLDPGSPVPEVFDDLTQSLVRHLQAARSLSVNGICGPTTWAWLGCRDPRNLGQVTIAIARQEAYAGAREIGGNNRGPFVRKYTGGQDGEKWEWCAAFAVWCIRQARAKLGLGGMPWLKTNPFSSSKNVVDAHRHRRLIHPQPVQTKSEHKCRVTILAGMPALGSLCIVRGGKTGYRHTTLLDRIEGRRAMVLEGNVRPLAWLSGNFGLNMGIVRPGSYPLSCVVFVDVT